jgi:glycosyltransferase involved in cell wall biosynthesis
MKIAIVHEWFVNYAGSEKLLEQILSLYPEADLYSIVDFLPSDKRDFIQNKPVKTSFIQKLPLAKNKYRNYLPLMPYAVSRFDLSDYDLVISNSHCVAKGAKTNSHGLHISYCYTPMRYVWDLKDQYLKETKMDKGMKGIVINEIFKHLKQWDLSTSKQVTHFITLSHYIRERIKRNYGRDSTVIYPPVDINKFTIHEEKEDFFLTVSRMVPYKKMDLIVEAFSDNKLPLVVIGEGPDFEKIKKKANKNIKLLGYQEDEVIVEHMKKARAFVFAAEEDFGIVPVEAQACGTPVIAYGKGGATETVVPVRNSESGIGNNKEAPPSGVFFNEQIPSSLNNAVSRFLSVEDKLNPHAIRENADRFSIERFRREFKNFVDNKMAEFY